jgi:hypothetical protein
MLISARSFKDFFQYEALKPFTIYARIHVVLIFVQQGSDYNLMTKMAILKPFQWRSVNFPKVDFPFIPQTTDTDVVFPIKLNNLQGYTFKVISLNLVPRMFLSHNKIVGTGVLFMKTFAERQNAKVFFKIVGENEFLNVLKSVISGKFDLTMASAIVADDELRLKTIFGTVNTFDTVGYCALVPLPNRVTMTQYIVAPFQWEVWVAMVVVVICYAFIWRFSTQNTNILTQIDRIIFGQGITIRPDRWSQVLIIQVLVFSAIVLDNLYQSKLTEVLTITKNETRISTIEELMNSDYNFYTKFDLFPTIKETFASYSKTGKFSWEMLNNSNSLSIDYKAKYLNRSVEILNCYQAQEFFKDQNFKFEHGRPSDYFYILPEKLLLRYEYLYSPNYSPFTKSFQNFFLKVTESGIKHHWELQMQFLLEKNFIADYYENDQMLKMKDLGYLFFIFGIGIVMSIFAFILEIF